MARQEARISIFQRANVSIPFTAEFYYNGDRVIITNNWRVVINRDLTSNEVILSHVFSPTAPYFNIIWDDEKDKTKDDAVKILMKHILLDCSPEVNPNLKKSVFKFENLGKAKSNSVAMNKKSLMVSNICNDFTCAQLRDIAFWYSDKLDRSKKIVDMSFEDIYLVLIDRKVGLLTNNPDDFLKRYKSPDVEYNVILNKALLLGIITQEKGFYFIGTEQIGASFEDLIQYSKINENMFNTYIKPEVKKRDKLPLDVDYSKSISSFMEDNITNDNFSPKNYQDKKQTKKEEYLNLEDEDDLIRVRAKNLGVKSWQTKKIENLKKEIALMEAPASVI